MVHMRDCAITVPYEICGGQCFSLSVEGYLISTRQYWYSFFDVVIGHSIKILHIVCMWASRMYNRLDTYKFKGECNAKDITVFVV
jgi:hypothetical protein